MNRRHFLQTTTLALTAAATPAIFSTPARAATKGVQWPIGCFNRPWVNVADGWTYEMALDSIKAAGYTSTGLLTPFKGETFISESSTPEYLAGLKERIGARQLKLTMGAVHLNEKATVAENLVSLKKQIDNAKFLGAEFVLTFGADSEHFYDSFYAIMAQAAPYAHDQGLKLVLKPHGGGSGAAEEILRCIKKVNQPNFKIWYDAGNIIYYTGKDPIEQLKPIAEQVTGFCAKDCAGVKGEIWLEFGTGKVDFPAVFAVMKSAGFNGPIMVECCHKGPTVADVTAGAQKNREVLKGYFSQL